MATYLLVVLHQGVLHMHELGVTSFMQKKPHHVHKDYQDVHHEHDFHIGVFHYLGHLFDNVQHSDDFGDEHYLSTNNVGDGELKLVKQQDTFFFAVLEEPVFEVDQSSLPSPPDYLSLLPQFKQINTPLRAPPALV